MDLENTYNRVLDPADYDTFLKTESGDLRRFMRLLANKRVSYRNDHGHKLWEYSMVWKQMAELAPENPSILDTGSGASYFPLFLATKGFNVTVSDSNEYGDPTAMLVQQCLRMKVELPSRVCPVEQMDIFEDGSFDIAMCLSVIEHVHKDKFADALHELARVTKIGGLVFITSDFFKDEASWEASKFRSIQHTCFREDNIDELLSIEPALTFVSPPDFSYRGDFVNNYSFVNMCFRKIGTNGASEEVTEKVWEDLGRPIDDLDSTPRLVKKRENAPDGPLRKD